MLSAGRTAPLGAFYSKLIIYYYCKFISLCLYFYCIVELSKKLLNIKLY